MNRETFQKLLKELNLICDEYKYELLKKYTSEKQALLEIRMHALWYIKGLPNIKEYKNKITSCKTEQEFKNLLNEIRENVK